MIYDGWMTTHPQRLILCLGESASPDDAHWLKKFENKAVPLTVHMCLN